MIYYLAMIVRFLANKKKEWSLISTLIYLIVLFETTTIHIVAIIAHVIVFNLTIQMGIILIFICTLRYK